MRLKAKIVHALPSFLSLLVIRITGTRAKALSRKITPRMYRTMEDSESSAAPLKREWMEAQGREKSQLGKRTQLSEQLPPFSQSGDFPGASSFHGLFPWGPGAEEGLGPETEASGERGETVTFTELPGKDGV